MCLRVPLLPLVVAFLAVAFLGVAQMTTHGDATDLGGGCYEVCLENNNSGGDGMAFVLRASGSIELQQEKNLPGSNGQCMGYYDMEPSRIVEMDTDRHDEANDPEDWQMHGHLALMRDGDPDHDSPNCLVQPVPAIPPDVNMEDNEWHTLRVKWDADAQEISVYFDCLLRFTETVDMVAILQGAKLFMGSRRVLGLRKTHTKSATSNSSQSKTLPSRTT